MKMMNFSLKASIIWSIGLLLLAACSTTPEKKAPPQPVSLVGAPPTAVITEEFASFLKGFPVKGGAIVYDAAWLQRFASSAEVKEISPKQCERYIYGHKVIAESHASRSLSKENAYYYVGRLPDNGQYIAIVFTDLADRMVSTYLCTYQRDGKFISGIVLQQLDESLPEKNSISHKVEVQPRAEQPIKIKPTSDTIAKGFHIDSMGNIEIEPATAHTSG